MRTPLNCQIPKFMDKIINIVAHDGLFYWVTIKKDD